MNGEQSEQHLIEKIKQALVDIEANAGQLQPETVQQATDALNRRLYQLRDALIPKADEVRLVSIMFIDVVGATHIAEVMSDDERWRSLLIDTHSQLAGVLRRWGGEVGQFLGDGLLCYFGARRSRGDDAMRAVTCAMATQEAMAVFRPVVEERYGVKDFQVRIGISTGRAVVGPLGQLDKVDILALGLVTNLAARLQTLAPPGGVVIDVDTYLQVRTEFEVTPKSPVTVKGFEEPVAYYLVRSQRRRTTTRLTTDRIEGIDIPFVGRHEIYQKILLRARRVRDKGGFFGVTIHGEIGLGKSRLLQEVARTSIAGDFAIVRMVGHYEQRDISFGLLRDMLATMCGLASAMEQGAVEEQIVQFAEDSIPAEDAAATGTVVGYLAGYGFEDSPYATSLHKSSMNRGNRLAFRWVMRWLLGYAGERPLLILVDNLQWADKTSIAMLNFLSHVEHPIMIIAATRAPLASDMGYLPEREHQELAISPLEPKQIRRLLTIVLRSVDGIPSELPILLSERSEGNPLYVEEFLRMLFDNNVFEKLDNGRWQVNSFYYQTVKGQLPNGLMGVFQARLDDLPVKTRQVVQVAACVGQTFWGACVNEVIGFDTKAVMEDLVDRDIVVRHAHSQVVDSVEYGFRNNLYFEVAYEMLPRGQRVAYHQAIADWLQRYIADNGQLLGVLATQHRNAEQMVAALRVYVEAAEYKLSRGVLSDTQALITEGMTAAQTVPRRDALPFVSRFWLLQAQIGYIRHRYGEAKADSQAASKLLKELPDDEMRDERVLANVTLANSYTSLGSYEEAFKALQEASRYVDAEHDRSQVATVKQAFGMLFWAQGRLDQADMYLREAYTVTSDGESEQVSVLSMLGRVALDKGDFGTALDYIERTLEANRRENNMLYQIFDLRLMAVIYRLLFAYDLALDAIERAEDIAAEIDYNDLLLVVNRGLCEIALGESRIGLGRLRGAMAEYYDDKHNYNLVKLSYIRGLVQLGYAQEGEQVAGQYLDEIGTHNAVLRGRSLLWYGLAQYMRSKPQAVDSLSQALAYESKHGGQSLWLCHYALGIVHPDREQATYHKGRAFQILEAIATSLYRRPALAEAVVDNVRIVSIFRQVVKDRG